MGSMSIYHWIILGVVVLVLFGGGGKISSLMGDFAKGIKSFKKSMAEDDTDSGKSGSISAPDVVPPSVTSAAQQKDVNMADSMPPRNPTDNHQA